VSKVWIFTKDAYNKILILSHLGGAVQVANLMELFVLRTMSANLGGANVSSLDLGVAVNVRRRCHLMAIDVAWQTKYANMVLSCAAHARPGVPVLLTVRCKTLQCAMASIGK